MSKRVTMSRQTRINWLVDVAVFGGGIVAALSGIYYLYVPSGGYQGGRNALYGVTILFDRATWSDLHTWGGVAMIIAVAVHVVIHWSWITMMSRRVCSMLRGKGATMSRGARRNLLVNIAIAVSFLVTAITGIVLLFMPGGGYQGGENAGWDPGFLWSRTAWDLIHTWAGTLMIIAAMLHFVIHWRWIKNVSKRFVLSLRMPNIAQHSEA